MVYLYLLAILSASFLVYYALFDAIFIWRHYFGIEYCAYLARKKKRPLASTVKTWGICLTQDVDNYWKHMNNVRITREMDFALYQFLALTGLWEDLKKNSAADAIVWKVASNTRFRRPVPIFSTFNIETKVVYWEKDSMYLEQQLVTKDNFVRAVSMVKVGVRGLNLEAMFEDSMASPTPSEELQAWISSIQISSKRLRGLA